MRHEPTQEILSAIHAMNAEPDEVFGPDYIEHIARDAIRDLVKAIGFDDARAVVADELNWIAGVRK
jgi:tRNA uridine 5-carbamoylmethylation protein Kti12